MIVIDTHIWIWWVLDNQRLSQTQRDRIRLAESDGIGVSAISCWEVAKLVAGNRFTFPVPVEDWLRGALAYPGVQLIALTPEIAIESTRLPGDVSSGSGGPDHRGDGPRASMRSGDL